MEEHKNAAKILPKPLIISKWKITGNKFRPPDLGTWECRFFQATLSPRSPLKISWDQCNLVLMKMGNNSLLSYNQYATNRAPSALEKSIRSRTNPRFHEDKFCEDWLFWWIHEKFRKAISHCNGSHLFWRANSRPNSSQPWSEGIPNKQWECRRNILQKPLCNNAGLYMSVIGCKFSANCISVFSASFVNMLIAGTPFIGQCIIVRLNGQIE